MTTNISSAAFYEQVKTNLNSEILGIRKQCLKELRDHVPDADTSFNLLKLVIHSVEDKNEVCRELALHVVIRGVVAWKLPPEETLSFLVPLIHKRIGTEEVLETSEEIRLLHVKLMKVLISNHKRNVCPFLEETVRILVNCVNDQYPELKKETCECISDLAKVTPEFRLHSDRILTAILPVLKHKHSKIRITAISCLGNLPSS